MTIYLEHFGLNEAPFKITPHTEFFFAGANRGETLEALIYAITSGEGMVKVTGEVGAGKTMLCRVLMERLPETVETIYLAVPSLAPDEILATIADDLGVEVQGASTTKIIRALQERLITMHASGKQVVALIDEAHAMPLETLEEIRLLSNLETSHDKLMQIVLFGQPELDEHLTLPNMRQLKERITHSFNLMPLPARDIKDYLNFRLRAAGYKGPDLFSPDALKLIAEASEGLTRRINIYADKTLLAAYADSTYTITPDHVRAAISDTQIVLPGEKSGRRQWLGIAASLVIGGVIGFIAGRVTLPTFGPMAAPGPAAPTETRPIVKAPEAASGDSPREPGAVVPAIAPPATTISAAPGTDSISKSVALSAAAVPDNKPEAQVAPQTKGAIVSPRVQVIEKASEPVPSGKSPTPSMEAPLPDVWLQPRMEADAVRLGGLPANRYSIQLMTADPREKAAIESFLRVASQELSADRLMIYPSGTRDNPRVSVIYGNFVERIDATEELLKLSAKVTRFKPYVRSVATIRADIRSRTE